MAVVDLAAPVPQTAAPLSDDQLLLQAVLRAAAELELSRTALQGAGERPLDAEPCQGH
jgi:hypothetical protein